MHEYYYLIFFILIFILVTRFFLPMYLLRRSLVEIINSFRNSNATTPDNAKTIEKLMLKNNYSLEKALQFLIKNQIVKECENNKLYLSEDTLEYFKNEIKSPHSNISKMWSIILPPDI